MAQYEDPMEQLFYESMELQMKIAKDAKVDAQYRTKTLNDLQTTYLMKQHHEQAHSETKQLARTANKALDQINKLKGDKE